MTGGSPAPVRYVVGLRLRRNGPLRWLDPGDRKLEVVNLRLGCPLVLGGKGDIGDDAGTAALCSEDLVRAVLAALEADVEPWQDIHIQSLVANQRYTTARAAATLGF